VEHLVKRILINLLVVLLIGVSGYLGYRLNHLTKAHEALARDHKKMTHRADLLQKKYAEQKAQTAAMQRAKLTVEGLKRQAEMKAEALVKKMEAQTAEMAAMQKKAEEKEKILTSRIIARDEAIEKWKESHARLTDKIRDARTTIKERESTIATLEENKQELESEVEFAKRTRDRYLSNNQEMAATAKSILARYDEKGVFADAIMNVEPFTQIKKVALEQLIQAYLDDIDDHVIRDAQ
jgi:DNA repair exonuclease SbcCD ATPase subunit